MISLFWLDDSGLTPRAVRLLIRYATEAQGERVSAPLGQTSAVCRMSPASVHAAEDELIGAQLLVPRGNRSFLLTLPAEAVPSPKKGVRVV